MPLTGSASTWRDAIISALGISFTGLSIAEETAIKNAWLAICQTHITHITTNALVSTTGTTGTGTPGGPLPIVSQPGLIT
jgi:hypothetical protein